MTQNSISADPQLIDKLLNYPLSTSVILVLFAAAVGYGPSMDIPTRATQTKPIVAEAYDFATP
jgi:hypothetical protein